MFERLIALCLLILVPGVSALAADFYEEFYFGVDMPYLDRSFELDKSLITGTDDSEKRVTPGSVLSGFIPDITILKDSTIKITGRKLISFDVSKRDYPNVNNIIQTTTQSSGTIDPSINQETQIKVEGTIKDRIFINVNYDDTKEDDDREYISVVYKGTEDEIIREVALGDIVLSLPTTEFISFNRQLFGAKGSLSVGPFSYYALVTKEEGVTKSASFSGYNTLFEKEIYNTSYSVYPVTLSLQQGISGIALPLEYGSVFLYYDDGVYVEEEDQDRFQSGDYYFEPMTEMTDYEVDYERGVVSLKRSIASGGTVAIIYTDALGVPHGDPGVGTFNYGELIYTNRNELEQQAIRDAFMLKSIYSIGGSDIDAAGLTVDVFDISGNPEFEVIADDSTVYKYSYLHLFGLDRNGDGEVDLKYLDTLNGRVDFSDYSGDVLDPDSVRPFDLIRYLDGSDPSGISADLPERLAQIRADLGDVSFKSMLEQLDNSDIYSESISRESKYRIYTDYYSTHPMFMLNQFGIIENSEKVVVDGDVLSRGRDYIIDYLTGTVQILESATISPNSDVEITYEYRPFSMSKSKTLFGNRLEYVPNDNLLVGASYMDEWTPETLDDIPRLGDETSRHRVLGANVNYDYRGADYQATVKAEVARSYIDPNTYGEVMIEDMESSEMSKLLSLSENNWKLSSPPQGYAYADRFLPGYSVSVGSVFDNYNFFDNDTIGLDEINSDYGDTSMAILRIIDVPVDPGEYFSYVYQISKDGIDVSEYKNLEIWYRVNSGASGSLHLDLGYVNEDVDGDSVLDTEDSNQDGKLGEGEDTGFAFDFGGAVYPIGMSNNISDSEDLNGNGFLNTDEEVVTYTVNMGDGESPEGNEWHILTIPLDSGAGYDENILRVVKHIRMWGEDFSPGAEVAVGRISINGTLWTLDEAYPVGSDVDVSTISKYDDPNYINLHNEVNKDTGTVLADTSLVLEYDITPDGTGSGYAFSKKDLGTGRDFTDYKKIRFYYFVDETAGAHDFVVRLATTRNDYYERTVPVTAADIGSWKYMEFMTDEIESESKTGAPSIYNINYLFIGVTADGSTDPFSGRIYINDIKLVDSNTVEGMAKTASLKGSYKDILSMNVKYTDREGNYAVIGSNPGTTDSTYSSMSGTLNAGKLFNSKSAVRMPINFSMVRSLSETNKDYVSTIYNPQRTESNRLSISTTFSMGKLPSLNYSYSKNSNDISNESSPYNTSQEVQSAGLSYTFPKLRLWSFNLIPAAANLSFSDTRDTRDYFLEDPLRTDISTKTQSWKSSLTWNLIDKLKTQFDYTLLDMWNLLEDRFERNAITSRFYNTYRDNIWILELYGHYRATYSESWSYEIAMEEGGYSLRNYDINTDYKGSLTFDFFEYLKKVGIFRNKMELETEYSRKNTRGYDYKESAGAGWTAYIGDFSAVDITSPPDSDYTGDNYAVSLNFDVLKYIETDIAYSYDTYDTINNGSMSSRDAHSWPDVEIRLNNINKMAFFSKLVRNVRAAQATLRYKRSGVKSYGYYGTETDNHYYYGDMRLSFKDISAKLSGTYNRAESESVTGLRYTGDFQTSLDINYMKRTSKVKKQLLGKSETQVNTSLSLYGKINFNSKWYTVGTDYYTVNTDLSGKYDLGTGMAISAKLGYTMYRSEIPVNDYNDFRLGGEFEILF